MAKGDLVWFLLTVATALFCLAYATLIDIATVRNNHQPSAGGKHHKGRIVKRSFFASNQMSGWFESRSDDKQRTFTLRYCWKDSGYTQYKQWVQEALDETWHRLKVVKFQEVGLCSESQRDYRGYPLEVLFWANCRGQFTPGKSVQIPNSFNASCAPQCAASKNAGERCTKSLAVHEFGHALGLAHEQNRPDTPSKFLDNDCTKYPEFRNESKWYLRRATRIGPWDEQSVMNYCRPGFFNWTIYSPLSRGDRAAVLSVYGTAYYFNSSCSTYNAWGPISAACQSAAQRYCETVFEDTQDVVGLAHSFTSNGLYVSCFKADFIQPTQDDDYTSSSDSLVTSKDELSERNDICEKALAGSLAADESTVKRYVSLPVCIAETGQLTVCKESIWLESFDEAHVTLLAQETEDWRRCRERMFGVHPGSVPYCVASVDQYCEQRWNGAAGIILEFDKDARVLKIGCFQALVKIELFAIQATSIKDPPAPTTPAPSPEPAPIPTANSAPGDSGPEDDQDPDPDNHSDPTDDSGSGSADIDPVEDTGSDSAPGHDPESGSD